MREQVVAAVRADRAEKDEASAADALVARLQKGETLEEVAKAEKLQITPLTGLQTYCTGSGVCGYPCNFFGIISGCG